MVYIHQNIHLEEQEETLGAGAARIVQMSLSKKARGSQRWWQAGKKGGGKVQLMHDLTPKLRFSATLDKQTITIP